MTMTMTTTQLKRNLQTILLICQQYPLISHVVSIKINLMDKVKPPPLNLDKVKEPKTMSIKNLSNRSSRGLKRKPSVGSSSKSRAFGRRDSLKSELQPDQHNSVGGDSLEFIKTETTSTSSADKQFQWEKSHSGSDFELVASRPESTSDSDLDESDTLQVIESEDCPNIFANSKKPTGKQKKVKSNKQLYCNKSTCDGHPKMSKTYEDLLQKNLNFFAQLMVILSDVEIRMSKIEILSGVTNSQFTDEILKLKKTISNLISEKNDLEDKYVKLKNRYDHIRIDGFNSKLASLDPSIPYDSTYQTNYKNMSF